ncbi:MAG: NTP transferase domain-containing protein, partial [Chloroflexi bacterium]|nr:NTP transferase domain-containing protein [Chloroflexota bacterium]
SAEATPEIYDVVVYGGDEAVRQACKSAGVGWRQDPGKGLNGCMEYAFSEASDEGFEFGMFLPADLPLVTPEDLSTFVETGHATTITIAPDSTDDGTNALLVDLTVNFPTILGEYSFSRHVKQAVEYELKYAVQRSEQLGLDIDTGADVEQLLSISANLWDELRNEIQMAGLTNFLQATEGTR